MRRMVMIWIGLAIVASSLTLAACGGGSDTTGAAESEPTTSEESTSEGSSGSGVVAEAEAGAKEDETIPSKILATEPVKPKAGSNIFYVACDLSIEGCANQAKGAKKASEVIGFHYEQCDGGNTTDTIAECFTQAINANPDVIIVNGAGIESAGPGYAEATKQHIPIVGLVTGDPGGTEGVATSVSYTTCTEEGEAAATQVIAETEGDANAVFIGTKTFACNIQREAGFKAGMEKCDECKVESLGFSIGQEQTALPQQIQAKLQANPDISYIVGTFDAVALAAVDAVRQAGKSAEIKVGGFDGNAPNLELIRNEEIQRFSATNGTSEPAWVAVDAAARVINGEEVPPETPVTWVTVTANNAEEIGEAYVGATGFEEQFTKLWGK